MDNLSEKTAPEEEQMSTTPESPESTPADTASADTASATLPTLPTLPDLPPDLPTHVVEKLQDLTPGTYVTHRSWGTGKIADWNADTEQLLIDFPGKPGHPMEFEYGTQSLKPLAADHILSRIGEDSAAVTTQAEQDPIALMQNVIQSLGTDATAERIEPTLSPAIVPKDKWKKWWDAAKRAMKKDPRFSVPSRRTEPIAFHEAPIDHKTLAMEAMRKAIGPKPTVTALLNLQKYIEKDKDADIATETVDLVNKTLAQTPKSQLPSIVELIMSRDELIASVGIDVPTGDFTLANYVPNDPESLTRLIDAMPSARQTQLLQRAREGYGDKWIEMFFGLIPSLSGKAMDVVSNTFKEEGRTTDLIAILERLIRERNLNPDLMVWICKNRKGELKELVGQRLFLAIIAVLEYDQLSDVTRGTRLHDLLFQDKALVTDLLAPASEEEVRDATRAVMLTTVFEDLSKRSLLAKLVKTYPFVQSIIIGEDRSSKDSRSSEPAAGQPLIVSWESLEKRKNELEEIVNKKIPQNTKDIAIAREYGDLRENHEFKAAKEMQTVLMRRKAELEDMLARAQGTDFKETNTNQVGIGTQVEFSDTESGKKQTYTILGAWDSNPEQNIISYLTPMAQALTGKKPGEEIPLTMDDGSIHTVRIETISPYITA